MKFVTSAVEKNKADRYLEVFRVVKKVAEALPSVGVPVSTAVNTVLNTGAQLLDNYKSSNTAYTDEVTVTLNSPQYKNLEAQALILMPTDGKPADVQQRIHAITNATFLLCQNAGGETLCTRENNTATPYTTYPYILLRPAVSYRISNPDFIWLKIPMSGAACPIDLPSADSYMAAIHELAPFLTSEQGTLERILERSTRTLLDVRSALDKQDDGKIFGLIHYELSQQPPTSGLYTYVENTRSYQFARDQLHRCTLAEANAKRPGLYTSFGDLVTLVNAPPPKNQSDLIQRYEAILVAIAGIQEVVKHFNIRAPEVTAITNTHRAIAEDAVYNAKFKAPIDSLRNPASLSAQKTDATNQLLALAKNPCTSCVKRATDALAATNSITQSEAETRVEAAEAITVLSGTVEVIQIANTTENTAINTTLAAETLSRLLGATDSATPRSAVAMLKLREAIDATKALTQQLGEQLSKANSTLPPYPP